MFKKLLLLAILAWLVALPALGGINYRAVTRGDVDAGTFTVEAWIEGTKARIEFRQSGNPMVAAGSYFVTQDGGQTLFLVNPKEKTYSKWDLDAMLKTAGALLEGMGGIASINFTNPKVEELANEDGETLLGLPTRHYRFKTNYDVEVKVLGMQNAQSTETVQDLWVTEGLSDVALGVWLRKEPAKTGNAALDQMIASEIGKVRGFPLKSVTTTVAKQWNRKKDKVKQETTSRMETVVESLDTNASTAGVDFTVPAGYTETPMLLPGAQGQEGEGENPLKGIFGGG